LAIASHLVFSPHHAGSPSFQAAQPHHRTANQNKKQRAAESLRADQPLNLWRDTFATRRIQGKSAPPRF
jgi:hypothetical protein